MTNNAALAPEMRPPPTAAAQRERILAAMRRRAGTSEPWVCGEDFREPTIDGHPPIHNITPRVSDLRRLHEIVTERGPDGCARYRLATDCGDSAPPFGEIAAAREAARSNDEQLALELPPASLPPKSAIFDWDL